MFTVRLRELSQMFRENKRKQKLKNNDTTLSSKFEAVLGPRDRLWHQKVSRHHSSDVLEAIEYSSVIVL